MSIFDNLRRGAISFLFPNGLYGIEDQRIMDMQLRREYRRGKHRQQITPKPGRTDDNIYINFCGLVIDRSISMLFGNGIEFDLPGEDETAEQQYIDKVWAVNKKEILTHRMGMFGCEDGTVYTKIVPGGLIDNEVLYPRMVLVDPKWVEMDTNPEDFEQVIRYTISFTTTGPDGKEVARKQIHEYQDATENWLIGDWQASSATGGKWELMQQEIWDYSFPQIHHGQNLPSADDVYGIPDLTDDIINLQDKLNFLAANINKIIRLHAHPKIWSYGLGTDNRDVISLDVGEMVAANQADAYMKAFEMNSDLSASSSFFTLMRQAFFDVARTVDLDSVQDKLGALTNFGLKVLYQDAINKVKTKQQLYGDYLCEINRRLLILAGFANIDPGEVVWPEPLQKNGKEESEELKLDLELGLVDKQTAAVKKGYDWNVVQERLKEQNVNDTTVGNEILRLFERGEK